jgi:hypothetical protein
MTELLEKLKQYEKAYGIPMDEIEERYNTVLAETSETDPVKRETKALIKLNSSLGRELGFSTKAIYAVGLFFGLTEIEDSIVIGVRTAEKMARTDRQRALNEGYIDEDGTALDRRTQVLGKPNPNFGKPLTGTSLRRKAVGIGRHEENGTWKKTIMNFYDDTAANIQMEFNRLTGFRANLRDDKPHTLIFNASKATRFTPIDGEVDVEKVLSDAGEIRKLDEIEDWIAINAKDRNALIIVRAQIEKIYPEVRKGKRGLRLTDSEIPKVNIGCNIPEYIPINFGEQSTVLVIARASMFNDKPWLNAIGIYPLPGWETSPIVS